MSFRRSFSRVEHSGIRNKAIVMTTAVVLFVVLIKTGVDFINTPAKIQYLKVNMLDRNCFIINNDTTNYKNFASVLSEQVKEYRKEYEYNNIEIYVQLPQVKNTNEIADIIKLVDAMDVKFSLHFKKK
ncbi:MAG: hypothetical protein MK207_05225 [Saprospiraceae bacterium]|nr:hypothetical protein [Saprospiraceae bacterium]